MAPSARNRISTAIVIGLALLFPVQQVLAVVPSPPRQAAVGAVRDVALQTGGVLQGQVINGHGAPVANASVSIERAERSLVESLSARTDQQGEFQFQGLGGGVYRIDIAAGSTLCRAWSPNTAPPAAGRGVLLVQGGEVIRGQMAPDYRRIGWTLLVVGVAVGIAIPLALDDDSSS